MKNHVLKSRLKDVFLKDGQKRAQNKVVDKKSRLFLAMGCLMIVFGFGCASSARKDPARTIERQSDRGDLPSDFETQLKLKNDSQVTEYLQKLTTALASSSATLQTKEVKVFLVTAQEGVWRSFNLPGDRIYLSVDFLRTLSFENELAALIAVQLGHLERASRLTIESEKLGAGNSEEADSLSATRTAVGILYRAGYDPRGLITVCNNYEKHLKHSPYSINSVEKLSELARREIASLTPLRNPVVRSQKFLHIRERIQRL